MRKTILVAAALTAFVAPLRAQTTITTALNTAVGPFGKESTALQSIGQSFVAPSLAPGLSSLSLAFTSYFNGAALRFDAYLFAFDAANRRVSGGPLATFLSVAGSGNEFDFDTRTFSFSNVWLTPGATYLFLVTTSNQGGAVPMDASNLLGASDVDAYADGALWGASNGADMMALGSAGAFASVDGIADASFTATFLPAPEPSTMALLGVGLAALAGIARRRRVG